VDVAGFCPNPKDAWPALVVPNANGVEAGFAAAGAVDSCAFDASLSTTFGTLFAVDVVAPTVARLFVVDVFPKGDDPGEG